MSHPSSPHPQQPLPQLRAAKDRHDAKWFVDGCGYMWAVSVAIEEARESIWILDWWLSPGMYLPAENGGRKAYGMQNFI